VKTLLQLGGALHFAILIASALTPQVLDWRRHLASLPQLLRRLFWVYGGFIVITIISFGALSLAHAGPLASGDPLARSVCGVIAFFWFARLMVQFFVFDPTPFLTNALLKIGYHTLTLAFALLVFVYGCAAFHPLHLPFP
jgi:hypothetical protein